MRQRGGAGGDPAGLRVCQQGPQQCPAPQRRAVHAAPHCRCADRGRRHRPGIQIHIGRPAARRGRRYGIYRRGPPGAVRQQDCLAGRRSHQDQECPGHRPAEQRLGPGPAKPPGREFQAHPPYPERRRARGPHQTGRPPAQLPHHRTHARTQAGQDPVGDHVHLHPAGQPPGIVQH